MKTRSEWGSWEDFKKVVPGAHHVERILPLDMNYCELTLTYSSFDATSETPEEARRLVVEKYAATLDTPLPWQPDYDLSTVEKCRKVIRESKYVIQFPSVSYKHMGLQIEPTLEQLQQFAQYVIDHSDI